MMIRLSLALLLLTFAGPAAAQDIAQIVGLVLLFIPGGQAYGAALLFASSVYGSIDARRKARKLEAAKRAAYNAGLMDRSLNAMGTVPPWQIIYGRVVTGGDIVAMFTTDKTSTRSDGTTYVRPDAYKHLVIVYAAHQVQAFNDFQIDGVSVGPLDGSGWVTSGELLTTDGQTQYREMLLASGGSTTQTQVVTVISCKITNSGYVSGDNSTPPLDGTYTITNGGLTINNTSGVQVSVQFTMPPANVPTLRITSHLGTDAQTVNTYLNGLIPTQWTAEHRLRGLAYATVTIDLDNPRFQGGPPNLTADISGKLLFDTRTSTTVYSANSALVSRDFLVSPWGAEALGADVDVTYCNAAANACDGLNTVTTNSEADGTRWDFNATVDGWTGANGTLTWVAGGTMSMTSSTTNPILRSPAALSIAGATYNKVRARIRRTAGAGWTGSCFYVTAGHGESASFLKTIANPGLVNGTWVEVTFDMAALTLGGTDWTTSTITRIRLDLGSTTADVFEVDWASVSKQVPLYTCNGVYRSDQSREGTLADIAESMGGFVYHGGTWLINAGAWTATVMDLADDDLDGQIEVVQGDAGMEEAFNSVRGTYIAALKASPTDFDPFVQSTFVTADGQNLWIDVSLPFTDDRWRCKQLCRVKTEQARNGQVITYPAKLKAWPLRVGDRIRVTSAEYGWTLKEFRVTDWQFNLGTAVLLTLQEDAAAAYDLVDAAAADPTPNSGLANPWVVASLAGLAAASGTNELARRVDGSIIERVRVSWTLVTDAYVASSNGRIEIQWRRAMRDAANVWHALSVAGGETQGYIDECVAGDMVTIQARAVNNISAFGPWSTLIHVVVGKSAAPGNVTSFTAVNDPDGSVVFSWAVPGDIDYAETEIHEEGSWTNGGPMVYRGDSNRFVLVRPSPGAHTYQVKHRDTTGNLSTTAASVTITVPGRAQANLIDASTWVFGSSGNQVGFTAYATSSGGSNSIINTASPDSVSRNVWRAISGTAVSGTDEGGFTTATFPVDSTKQYRFSVWIKCSHTGASRSGVVYVGPDASQVAAIPTGTTDTNPYFHNAIPRVPAVGNVIPGSGYQWQLFVGYVQPSNIGTTQTTLSGIYDGVTGAKLSNHNDFKWVANQAVASMRVRQYQTALTNNVQDMWGPAVYLCDGSEPTIGQLLAVGTNPGRGNALNFDPNVMRQTAWALSGRVAAITDGQSGHTVLESADDGTDNAVFESHPFPIDRTKSYRLSFLARKTAGTAGAGSSMHFGFQAWKADGNYDYGMALYFSGGPAVSVITVLTTSFQRFTRTLTPADLAAYNAAVVGMSPHFTLGFTGAGGGLVVKVQVQDVRIEEVITVDSQQILANAATEVVTVLAAGPVNCLGTYTTVCTANFGPYPVETTIECSFVAEGRVKWDPDAIGPPLASILAFIDGSSGTDSAVVTCGWWVDTVEHYTGIAVNHTFVLPANTSGSAIAKVQMSAGADTAPAPAPIGEARNAILRCAVIKR